MKILKSELQKIILEVTQGEMEFAELERARQDRDWETATTMIIIEKIN